MCTFLLSSEVVESATANDRPSSRQPRPESVQVGSLSFIGEWLACVEDSVLNKHEGVTVESINATLSDYVDEAARPSPRFCGKPVINYLKLLHGLWGQFRTGGASEIIIVLNTIDVKAVAARAQACEREPAVGKRTLAACGPLNIRAVQLRCQKYEVEVISADNGLFFNSFMTDCGRFGGLGRINWRRLF